MASEPVLGTVSAPARACLDCGLAVAGQRKLCDGCKAQRNRDRVAKWQRENPEKRNARFRRWYAENAATHNERTMDWARRNPSAAKPSADQQRGYYLKWKYGITLDDERAMLAVQGGCCAICRKADLPDGQRWHVDHDHETGAVRGLLCRACNLLLGHAGDDPTVLAAAITYLEQASTEQKTA
jgi:hypothetical protein